MSSIHDSFSLTFNYPYCFSKFARFQVDFSLFINFTRIFYFDPFISSSRFANCENNLRLTDEWWVFHHQWRLIFPVGANPPKFPTKLSNFRQPPPPFSLEKPVFSPRFRLKFSKNSSFSVKVAGGGGGGRCPPPPYREFRPCPPPPVPTPVQRRN